ncbi:hypothetical protein [Calidifontibacter terrae]
MFKGEGRRLGVSMSVVAVLVLVGCGSGDSDDGSKESAASTGTPAQATFNLQCSGTEGNRVHAVTVRNSGAGLIVDWSGQAAGADFVSYIVTVTGPNGEQRQFGRKVYTTGEPTTMFMFDLGSGTQTNLDADVNSTEVSNEPGRYILSYPEALYGFGEGAKWSATADVNVDGQDIGQCR